MWVFSAFWYLILELFLELVSPRPNPVGTVEANRHPLRKGLPSSNSSGSFRAEWGEPSR